MVTVLAAAADHPRPAGTQHWGHPVDKLRYGFTSFQIVTLKDRLHLRR